MGLACGGILEVIGIVSNSSFDLMLAMELKNDSGMICGRVRLLLRIDTLLYTRLC